MQQIQALFGTGGWREAHAQVFRSDLALRWFLRRYRPLLVERGALVMLAGRWHATDKMADAVLEIGQTEARAMVEPTP